MNTPHASVTEALHQALQHHQQGRLPEAEALYRRILQVAPAHADALHLLGVVALQRGQFEAAAELIGRAVSLRPADNFCCNLGNAQKALGLRDQAIASYRQALALNPQMPEAHCNLGDVLLQDGQAEAAAASCRRAIALRPGMTAAHFNLGNALLQLGRLPDAIGSYRQALHHGPATAGLHGRLGHAHALAGDVEAAVLSRVDALECDDSPETRAGFVQAVRELHFHTPQPAVRTWLLRALEQAWAGPGELLTPATSLVEANPALHQALTRALTPAGSAAAVWAALSQDRLLLRLLETEPLNSITLERLLTGARRQLLDAATAGTSQAPAGSAEAADGFACALARQCFINEYIWAFGDEETRQLAELRARLADCHRRGQRPPAQWLVALAACAPLGELAGASEWAALPWPAPLAALFQQQFTEPATEARLRTAIPRLTPIEDGVSRQVQAQYEAHPYPRWVQAPAMPAPEDLGTLLRRRFAQAALQLPRGEDGLDLLVAGCGTGLHPIQAARQYRGARVLAIDLSLASLAYAQRKSAELGLDNIQYAQADLLALGATGLRFDLIESAGVLHHLADPLAGWRVLCQLLRPGGLMFIGLYSELGRRDVVQARELLAGAPLPDTTEALRHCRQALMSDATAPRFAHFLRSRDFYATSACRDLLYHVQEHRFTLPQLQQMLVQLGLRFIGFEAEPALDAEYTRRFPDDPARSDLLRWHTLETALPQSFSRMYQFWVQKPH